MRDVVATGDEGLHGGEEVGGRGAEAHGHELKGWVCGDRGGWGGAVIVVPR